ncbi:septum site-determining protein MinC [Chromatium weissei]|nr:septum site-determining protein MinC [Chromatium weissei]
MSHTPVENAENSALSSSESETPARTTSIADSVKGFELKAAGFTLPIIRVFDHNIEAIAARLTAKVEQAPDFFHNMPVVIDLSRFPSGASAVGGLPLLIGLLRGYGMIPFGVRGGTPEQNDAAEALGLALLRDSYVRAAKITTVNSETEVDADDLQWQTTGSGVTRSEASTSRKPVNHQGSMLIKRPVRSGQRVYAAGGDLSIVAAVSSGAELMADGNIHVYGALRGRALAGMNGNLDARIFCQDLQAELVSIAGHYRVSENIPAEMQGFPVQIFLDQKILRIERL